MQPEIQVQSFAAVRTALEDAGRFDVLIVDGKPNASDQTYEIAQAAELVCNHASRLTPLPWGLVPNVRFSGKGETGAMALRYSVENL